MRILPISGYQSPNKQNFGMCKVDHNDVSKVVTTTGAKIAIYLKNDSGQFYKKALCLSLSEFNSYGFDSMNEAVQRLYYLYARTVKNVDLNPINPAKFNDKYL